MQYNRFKVHSKDIENTKEEGEIFVEIRYRPLGNIFDRKNRVPLASYELLVNNAFGDKSDEFLAIEDYDCRGSYQFPTPLSECEGNAYG